VVLGNQIQFRPFLVIVGRFEGGVSAPLPFGKLRLAAFDHAPITIISLAPLMNNGRIGLSDCGQAPPTLIVVRNDAGILRAWDELW
jgi:hypothetical protein